MRIVAMVLRGWISKSESVSAVYLNGSRPQALAKNGYAICEIELMEPSAEIDEPGVAAMLKFMRVVEFDDGQRYIDLYDGRNCVMRFEICSLERPMD